VRFAIAALALAAAACSRPPDPPVDPQLAAEIAAIKAIDHHAHPVRPAAAGEEPDHDYDALPVEMLEPASDPVRLRPDSSAFSQARRVFDRGKGPINPSAALDAAGIDQMIANRVSMGPGLPRDRFLWAAYADALMYPFDTGPLARDSDHQAFFALEGKLLKRYYAESAIDSRPRTLGDYMDKVVRATLERHKQRGAIAEKFEMAYLRPLEIGNPSRADAEAGWRTPSNATGYRAVQDFIFRFIAGECGRLGMAVHFHTGEGAGSYYDIAGANPLLLEPLFNDPALRMTNFVLVHGGWPFTGQVTALLMKPNVYVDFSVQGLLLAPSSVAQTLRSWLEYVPEKVMFGTDGYPYAPAMGLGWEETTHASAQAGRTALGMALTAMLREGTITRERASELARMVLRDNARKLYNLK
jgi:predicted TIM-barrel fold metal-dependent hydrolase